jgi:hypothetical protein
MSDTKWDSGGGHKQFYVESNRQRKWLKGFLTKHTKS